MNKNLLRAYRRLIRSGEGETRIWAMAESLIRDHPLSAGSDFTRVLPADMGTVAANALVQKLIESSLNVSVFPPFMLLRGGVRSPSLLTLPRAWRNVMTRLGVLAHPLSRLSWILQVVQKMREGLHMFKIMRSRGFGTAAPHERYGVLYGLPPHAWPQLDRETQSHTMAQWFKARFSLPAVWVIPSSPQREELREDYSILPHPFPRLDDGARKAFRKAGYSALLHSFLHVCAGRWQAGYMLKDILEWHYMRLCDPQSFASMYAFTNSYYIRRPLWTHAVERAGSGVALIFYSTNGFDWILKNGRNGVIPGYRTMTWPTCHTMTDEHAAFLKETVLQTPVVHVEGVIPFEDDGQPLSLPPGPKIALFDVQPFRESFMASIGRPAHLYTMDVTRRVFRDVEEVCAQNGISLFCKPKRDVGTRLPKAYSAMMNQMTATGRVRRIDSSIAASRLCDAVDAVICQPFTSVAFYAAAAGKPVVFYDPDGVFEKEQPACQGIRLIHGAAELSAWIEEVLRVPSKAA